MVLFLLLKYFFIMRLKFQIKSNNSDYFNVFFAIDFFKSTLGSYKAGQI
jgi:hypothetical protein